MYQGLFKDVIDNKIDTIPTYYYKRNSHFHLSDLNTTLSTYSFDASPQLPLSPPTITIYSAMTRVISRSLSLLRTKCCGLTMSASRANQDTLQHSALFAHNRFNQLVAGDLLACTECPQHPKTFLTQRPDTGAYLHAAMVLRMCHLLLVLPTVLMKVLRRISDF